jgi:MFS family permease
VFDITSQRHEIDVDIGAFEVTAGTQIVRRDNSPRGAEREDDTVIPALLPQFIEAWSLTNTQAGWLAGIVSAGYMLAVIPLVSFTDRRPARQIYLASSALSALSCFGIALCDSLLPALAFRASAGIGMAGMYMPSLRASRSFAFLPLKRGLKPRAWQYPPALFG